MRPCTFIGSLRDDTNARSRVSRVTDIDIIESFDNRNVCYAMYGQLRRYVATAEFL